MTRLITTMTMIAAFMIPSVSFAGDVAAGNAKFQTLCVSCHGPTGKGDGPTGKALAAAGQPAPRDFSIGEFKFDTDKDGTPGTDADIKNVVTKGALSYGGSPLMAPVQGLSDADLDYFVDQFERFGFRGGVNYYRNLDRNWEITEPFANTAIEVPTIFIAGEKDGVIRGASLEALEASMSSSVSDLREVVLISDVGHWVQQEAPQQTSDAIVGFLGSV